MTFREIFVIEHMYGHFLLQRLNELPVTAFDLRFILPALHVVRPQLLVQEPRILCNSERQMCIITGIASEHAKFEVSVFMADERQRLPGANLPYFCGLTPPIQQLFKIHEFGIAPNSSPGQVLS